MGQEPPEEWPEFEPGKWYCVTVDVFEWFPLVGGCDNPYIDSYKCCLTGAAIQAFIDGGFECAIRFELCPPSGPNLSRIIGAEGPYDTQAACIAAC